MTSNLKPGERLDDLQIKGYRIIQSPGRFCFGMDAVLLSAFAKVKAGERALDLGTGTGILPILLEANTRGTPTPAWRSRRRARTWPGGALAGTTWRTGSIS